MSKIEQINVQRTCTVTFAKDFAVERVFMNTNARLIALSLLKNLKEDLMDARLSNGSPVLDVADLRQYIDEEMGRIRTNALLVDGLGGDNSNGHDFNKSNGHNGKAHREERIWRERAQT